MIRQKGILLVGPTGSGKSPLGDWLQLHGLGGLRCEHFDFGVNLRAIAAAEPAAQGFTPDEVLFIQDVVAKGVLLENETFHLARRILEEFMSRRQLGKGDLIVMNGLPRHVGQAEALESHLEFVAVVHLQCSAETVWERLQGNSGGDRAQRSDDELALVTRKLAIFDERTKLLLAFYQQRGVPLIPIAVGVRTQPADVSPILERVNFGDRRDRH
jgi:adenylate kinase